MIEAQGNASAAGIAVEFGVAANAASARIIATSDPWSNLLQKPEFQNAAQSRRVTENVWELTISDKPEAATLALLAFMADLGFIVLI